MKSFKRNRRNEWASASAAPILLSATLLLAMPNIARPQCSNCSTPCRDDPGYLIDAVTGWDGDYEAVYAHLDGGYRVRNDKCTTVSFGIYTGISHSNGSVQWYNDNGTGSGSGYLPRLTTQFERDNCTVKISSFGDKITVGTPPNQHDYVAIYTRVSIYNHDPLGTAHIECPDPIADASAHLVPLTSRNCQVPILHNQTVYDDYVIAADKFGNSYDWPSDTDLAGAGSWDTHQTHMATYWNTKLGGIVNITQLPDQNLINAYKAGYIYTHIVKDGYCLNVAEGPLYDCVFNHDEMGILTTLLTLGDFTDAQTFLANLGGGNFQEDAAYKYPWPWAIYLEKTGDTGFVTSYFNNLYNAAHNSIHAGRTGPVGIMGLTTGTLTTGFWTVDNWSALMGLAAYKYICHTLGNATEETWATVEYNSLLASVNNVLSLSMTSSTSPIPESILESNALIDPRDADWASMFRFGRWAWDGYLFGATQSGLSFTNIDDTYDAGILAGHAAGLDYHNFGFFPGYSQSYYSTAYNAGEGSAALLGEKYRSEGIYAYQFMIGYGQSGPFSWHEDYYAPGTGPWVGKHPVFGYPDSPHMWGQSNATKGLIDSLISEKVGATASDGSVVIIGRGIPNGWVAPGQTVAVSNFPITAQHYGDNNRTGFNLQGVPPNQITLTLTGPQYPTGGAILDLRALLNNIQSVTAGTPDSAHGTVTLPPGITSTTITLSTPNPTPIPTPTPLPTPSYTPPVGGGTLMEAEYGTLHGCYFQPDPNASGGGRVDGLNANGDYVGFTNFRGTSVIKIRYASPYSGTFGLYVGNTRVAGITILSTGDFGHYSEATVNVTIPTGAAVRFQYDANGLDVPITLDCIVVGVIEMESGMLSGNARLASDYYASAGRRVDGLSAAGDRVTFNNFPASSSLAVRYSSSNGNDATLSLLVSGRDPRVITLPHHYPAGGGGTYAYTDTVVGDVNIPLGATVTFQGNTGSALYDSIIPVTKLEAENAQLTGCSKVADSSASNGYRVDGIDAPGDSVSFTNVSGGSRLTFRYAYVPNYGLLNLYVDGLLTAYVYFPAASSWTDKTLVVYIHPGATVKLQFDDPLYNRTVSLDYIRVY